MTIQGVENVTQGSIVRAAFHRASFADTPSPISGRGLTTRGTDDGALDCPGDVSKLSTGSCVHGGLEPMGEILQGGALLSESVALLMPWKKPRCRSFESGASWTARNRLWAGIGAEMMSLPSFRGLGRRESAHAFRERSLSFCAARGVVGRVAYQPPAPVMAAAVNGRQ